MSSKQVSVIGAVIEGSSPSVSTMMNEIITTEKELSSILRKNTGTGNVDTEAIKALWNCSDLYLNLHRGSQSAILKSIPGRQIMLLGFVPRKELSNYGSYQLDDYIIKLSLRYSNNDMKLYITHWRGVRLVVNYGHLLSDNEIFTILSEGARSAELTLNETEITLCQDYDMG